MRLKSKHNLPASLASRSAATYAPRPVTMLSRSVWLLSGFAVMILSGLSLSSCGGSSSSTHNQKQTAQRVVEKADPFTVLDEQVKAGNIDPNLVQGRVDAARQEWLRAVVAQQKNDKKEVVDHFENAIEILNRLLTYPGVDTNNDFQEVTRNVIADYEKYVAKIDELPPNASMAAFKSRFDEEMAKMDIKNVPPPRIDLSKTTVPLTTNTAVEQTIAYFTQGNGRPYMTKWLARTGKYFPMMREVMKQEGVPEEIMHLAMIESGLNPNAVSWAKAVGMWQFIDATGSRYGLDNNWWFDKRRDPVTATHAAARHLRDLHNALGDWYLALAAYNSGINRVRTAMSQAGSNDFWTIRPFLPKETQNYVPLYIAATLISLDPSRYGFNDITYEAPLKFDTVYVHEAIDLNALAKAAGVSALELKELNPELLQPSTPPLELCGPDGYCLRLPAGSSTNFADRLASIPAEQRRPWMVHTVGRGETLRSIAHLYGIDVSQLADYNDMTETERVRRGQKLRVPMAVMGPTTGSESGTVTPANSSSDVNGSALEGKVHLLRHKVKKHETLNAIAHSYGVSVQDLREWNNLGRRAGVRKGQSLKVYQAEASHNLAHRNSSKTAVATAAIAAAASTKKKNSGRHWVAYKVRRGDTMGKIADAFGVDLDELKSWNHSRHPLKAGQSLKVYASADAANESSDELEQSSTPKMHTVRPGETLTSIARTYGVKASDVSKWNNDLAADELQAGSHLKLYASNMTAAKGDHVGKTSHRRPLSYRVKRGDTLYSIADKYDVTVGDLRKANHLRRNALAAGARIIIPVD